MIRDLYEEQNNLKLQSHRRPAQRFCASLAAAAMYIYLSTPPSSESPCGISQRYPYLHFGQVIKFDFFKRTGGSTQSFLGQFFAFGLTRT